MKEPSSLDWVGFYVEEPKDLVSTQILDLKTNILPFIDVISLTVSLLC